MPPLLFVVPQPLTANSFHWQSSHSISNFPRKPSRHVIPTLQASADAAYTSRASSALNQESAHSTCRYVDLRTMKLISDTDAHTRSGPTPDITFGIFDNPDVFDDERQTSQLRDLLFTQDTIPLNDTQKKVVQSLLSRRSVLYMAAAGDEKDSIFIDIVMRNRLWKECVVYCAASRRSAEAMYAMLCAQLGPERRAEVCLDLGDGVVEQDDTAFWSKEPVRVVITLPHVLRGKLVISDPSDWIVHATIVFIDNFSVSSLEEWEELLLAMPTRILVCIFMKEPATADRELLPLWLETIQNSAVAISPSGAASLRDRIDRPDNFPLLRTFAYNAALHESPVQLSLTVLKDMLQRERDSTTGDFVPKFSECFLHGVDMLAAEKTAELDFGSIEEAEYADVASLVVGDARMTENKIRARSRRRTRAAKRKDRTAASRAAAKRRREAAIKDSLLLPAIVLINGRKESESAAFAIRSALGKNATLLWDDDSRDLLEDLVKGYEAQHSDQMSETDIDIMQGLLSGIGIVHDGCVPAIRSFVEELFRGQLIPVIVADTHLGSTELLALPCAKSVLVESSSLALCDDPHKGLIKASTAATLAGRMGKDDVGNLIALWYDEAVDDEAAGNELASTLFYPLFSNFASAIGRQQSSSIFFDDNNFAKIPDLVKGQLTHMAEPNVLSSSYDGVLRALRCFGVDGSESILEYTLYSYKGWLQRASLRATVEKMEVEKRAIDERLDKDDKNSIADHERRLAKVNEANRVVKAMRKRYKTVIGQRVREELQLSSPGRIIGVRSSDVSKGLSLSYSLLRGHEEGGNSDSHSQENGSMLATKERQNKVDPTLDTFGEGSYTAAVFVAVRDQGTGEKPVKSIDHQWIIICVLADSVWTMLPLQDVVGLSSEEDNVIPNVDLSMIPHPATFDFDPTSGWATCTPVDETEKLALYRISDDLMSRITSEDKRLVVDRLQIPEYESQRKRLERFEVLYRQSPWYGRDDELSQRRQLRRRAAELGDDIAALQHKENELEEQMFNNHNHQLTSQSAVVAVLEDCHAVKIFADRDMEMTPIGALGSVLPGRYPLFTAACLSLIDNVEGLSVAEFAAYIAIVASSGRIWRVNEHKSEELESSEVEGDNVHEELDLSILKKMHEAEDKGIGFQNEKTLVETDGVEEVLPVEVAKTIHDILAALQHLHRRHRLDHRQEENDDISEIVPAPLNTRLARAVHMFASGVRWREVVEVLRREEAYGVRELRHVRAILDLIIRSEEGEFSDRVRELASQAYDSLDRWPVRDRETIVDLVDSGVVEKHWNGNTYEKWWRNVREEISAMNGKGTLEDGEEVESAMAEIMESP